jgi:transcription initiation factor TFIIB
MDEESSIWNLLESIKDQDISHAGGVTNAKQCVLDPVCDFCKADAAYITLDDGNYVCRKCGTMSSRFIDSGPEWRFYGCEDNKGADPTRCGMPTSELLPDSSMGSVIGYTSNESSDMRIIRKFHLWNCMTYKERSLYNIFDTLTINAVNHGIPKTIIEEAKVLYKKISEMKISRGENRSGLIASSIYMSCKTHKVPRSTKEIARIFNLKPTVMTRGCKKFQDIMKMNMESTNPDDFISRFCSKLSLDTECRDMCKHVLKRADDLSIISENTPPSIAAGCIYLCSTIGKWGLSKKDLAEACEISQVTISKCYKKLWTYIKQLLTPDICKQHNISLDELPNVA